MLTTSSLHQPYSQEPLLPCNKVLEIQELQDFVRVRLPFRDLKTCTLVCRHWYRLFEPFLWTKVNLYEHDHGKMTILRRYGSFVSSLNHAHAHKSTFGFIRTYCSVVQSLSLVFDNRSSRISYANLEEFFRNMSGITTLSIRFDASRFSPAMFWSFSQLPHLTRLTIDVYFESRQNTIHYPPDTYMTILDCCPTLEDLTVFGLFLKPTEHHKNSLVQWAKYWLRHLRESPPSSSIEAMKPPIHTRSSSAGSTLSRLGRGLRAKNHRKSIVNSIAAPSFADYNIRKLDLRSRIMEDKVLCKLISRCPLLEDLSMDGLWVRISSGTWETLSNQCPRFRSLTIRDSGVVHYLPSIPTLMTLFPRLESVSLITLEFKRDPDLSTLATKIQEIEQQCGVRHPLKHIHISGSILKPLKVMLDVVTQCSTVESLSVGFTLNALRVLENEAVVPFDINKQWMCHDSLLHLDLTSISFKSKNVFKKFIAHVQRLTRLKSLWISVSHMREAWSIKVIQNKRQPLGGATGSQVADDSSSPTSFFCFPTVEILHIGTAYRNEKLSEMPIVYDEVVYMIGTAPSLKRLELEHLSESGIVKRLSLEYPMIEFL
ncbi:hypothetical protein BGX27_000575 [Mortierella sp. AM989]|nr:hypothetical protein BGX27_000575 [Mortierella sp. AM989]